MQQQKQLALLEEAMKSRKDIEILTEETSKLKEKLSIKQDTLNRLQKLCLASASLLNSVDSSSAETEMSSLKCLTKLDQSTAVVPTENEEEEDQMKLIVGKYLNQILAVIVDFSEQNNGNMNLINLIQLEQKLNQLFAFAESKEIIPKVDEAQSWKKGVALHKPLIDKITEINDQKDEEEE